MDIQKIKEVFYELKETGGRLDKESILQREIENEEFKFTLEFLLNPYKVTGIKSKKLGKFINQADSEASKLKTVKEACDFLVENNTGTDETVKEIVRFIYDNISHKEFLVELLTKEFKCGITSNTVNKIYGKNYIPKFEVMLAKSYEKESHKVTGDFTLTTKLDGIRMVAMKENGIVKFYTRQGQPILELIEIEKAMENMLDNYVYDGELLLFEDYNLYPTVNELFRATQKEVRKDGVKLGLQFVVFDLLPVEEFKEGKSKLKYEERLKFLNEIDYKTDFIVPIKPLYTGNDTSKIQEWLDWALAKELEGIMLNNHDSYYTTKRTDGLLKIKKMYTIDLEVTGYEEGTGKHKGKLGSLIVDYKGFPCGVGSGFTDVEREKFWSMRDELTGRIIEVQYFEESQSEKGNVSLRFPVFKELREEGKEVSYH